MALLDEVTGTAIAVMLDLFGEPAVYKTGAQNMPLTVIVERGVQITRDTVTEYVDRVSFRGSDLQGVRPRKGHLIDTDAGQSFLVDRVESDDGAFIGVIVQ